MMNLELSIYEAERYGEIDEDTRDMMLEMVAMEATALNKRVDALRKERSAIRRKTYQTSDRNEIRKYNEKISDIERKIRLITGQHPDESTTLDYGRGAAKERAIAASHEQKADEYSNNMRKEGSKLDELESKIKKNGKNPLKNLFLNRKTKRELNSQRDDAEFNYNNNMDSRDREIRKRSESLYQFDDMRSHGQRLKKKREREQEQKAMYDKESVDDLKMDIYESERYGEISIEERDELLSYLD